MAFVALTSCVLQAYFLKLRDGGAQLRQAWAAFSAMSAAIDKLNWYYLINFFNILLLIAR